MHRVYKYLRQRQERVCSWCLCFHCCVRCTATCIRATQSKKNKDPFEVANWLVSYAPFPDDINWSGVSVGYKMVWLRNIAVNIWLFFIFFFLSTPTIVLKAMELLNIKSVLSGGQSKVNSKFTEYFSTLTLMLMTVVLPFIVTYACRMIPYKTISALNHAIMWKVYLFLVMMVIILPSLGLSSASMLVANLAIKNGSESFRWECLFPVDNGAFFVNYVLQAAFIGNGMELLRLPELLLYFILMIYIKDPSEYENARRQVVFDFQFGIRYPRFLLIFTMVVIYSLACPLIAPAGTQLNRSVSN